jgi:hypothetical protein
VGAAVPVEEPATVPGPRAAQDDPGEQLSRLRLALTGAPGGPMAAAAQEAADPLLLSALGEPGMLELVRAGRALAAWGESLQLQGLAAMYQSRRRLDGRELESLASIEDVQELVAAARRLQAGADDLAGRSVVAEAAAVCGVSEYSLHQRLDAALELDRLPATAEALRAGLIDWPKTKSITDATRALSDDQAAAVEARCLPAAARQNTRAVQATLAAAVSEIDPLGTAQRHHAARADRGISFRLGRDPATTADGLPDGTAEMHCRMGAVELLDLRRNLDLLAQAAKTDSDTRTLNQRRIDTLVDVFANAVTHLHPQPSADQPSTPAGQPTTQADQPTTQADQPTTQAGEPSAHVNEPTARINGSALPAPAPAAAARSGSSAAAEPHIIVTVALNTLMGQDDTAADLTGYGPIPASIARDLATRGTWRCAATDNHGTILGLGRTTFTPNYRPPGATARLIRHRDRTCVFPGCRRQARRCDLDHRTPHSAGGATCECNLQILCGNHHRLKHETGFQVRTSENPDAPPGTLTWTTPTGHTVRRHPVPAGRTPLPDGPPF